MDAPLLKLKWPHIKKEGTSAVQGCTMPHDWPVVTGANHQVDLQINGSYNGGQGGETIDKVTEEKLKLPLPDLCPSPRGCSYLSAAGQRGEEAFTHSHKQTLCRGQQPAFKTIRSWLHAVLC